VCDAAATTTHLPELDDLVLQLLCGTPQTSHWLQACVVPLLLCAAAHSMRRHNADSSAAAPAACCVGMHGVHKEMC
jgi:hypothetical protein